MVTLAFDAVVEKDGIIRVPDEIAGQVPAGATVRVSVSVEKSVSEMTREEALQSILAFIDRRMAEPTLPGEPYRWNREELYDHLKKYYADDTD